MNRIVERARQLIVLATLAYLGVSIVRYLADPRGLVAFLAILLFFPFVVGPILIHRTQEVSLTPNLVPFDPDGPGSPEELRYHFAATAEGLKRLGFSAERYYQAKQAASHAEGWVLLYRNKKTGETARVITSVGISDTIRIGTSFVVLTSEFTDATVVITSNRTSAIIYPSRKPPYYSRAFPQIREVDHLLVVHRARVENLASGRIAVDPVGDDPDGYIRRVDFEDPFAYHVACGYSYHDEMEGVQRMTWKGAILSTWKLLPPFKQIRLAWERLMAARQLGKLRAGRPIG